MNKTYVVRNMYIYLLSANTLTIISFYSMWHIMLSDIPQLKKKTLEPFLYNNLTINTIWVCCIYNMSLFHSFKPWPALVLNKTYRCTDNVMTVKSWQNHCLLLF